MVEELKVEKIKALESVISDLSQKQAQILKRLNESYCDDLNKEYFRTSLAISLISDTQKNL